MSKINTYLLILTQFILHSPLFEIRFDPHYIWLNSSVIVVAETTSEHVTPQNIHSFLHDKNFFLPAKQDEKRIPINYSQTLLSDSQVNNRLHIEHNSLLTSHLKGASSVISRSSSGDYMNRRLV